VEQASFESGHPASPRANITNTHGNIDDSATSQYSHPHYDNHTHYYIYDHLNTNPY
jgi:hypothetical protein